MSFKTYASKANAKRAFNKTDYNIEEFEFVQNSGAQWYWIPKDEEDEQFDFSNMEGELGQLNIEVKGAEELPPGTYNAKATDAVVDSNVATLTVEVQNNDAELIEVLGTCICPHCDVNLGNGYDSAHNMLDDTNRQRIAYGHAMRHEFLCLACGEEFGPEREQTKPEYKPAKKLGSGIRIQKDRPEQYGIRMPSEGGATRKIWDWCSDFVTNYGGCPTNKEVHAWGVGEAGINKHTVSTQYARWKRFQGISGRIESMLTPKVTETTTKADA